MKLHLATPQANAHKQTSLVRCPQLTVPRPVLPTTPPVATSGREQKMTSLVRKLTALFSSNHTAQQQQKPEADVDEGEPVVATDPEAQGCDAKREKEKEDTETTRAEKEDTVNNKGEEEGAQAGDSSLRAGSSISDETDNAGEGEKKASAEEDEPQPAQPNVAKRTKKKKKVTVQTTTDGTKRANNNESDEKKERRPTLVGRLRTHSLANIFKLVSSEPTAEQQGAPLDPADAEGPAERDGLLFKEGTLPLPPRPILALLTRWPLSLVQAGSGRRGSSGGSSSRTPSSSTALPTVYATHGPR